MPSLNVRQTALIVATTILVTLGCVRVAVNFMSGEKKIERRIERVYALDDPRFRQELGALLGPALVAGNRHTVLRNGDEIFPAMLAAIRAARTSITFETYIYWSGDIGREFADALAGRACKRASSIHHVGRSSGA
jgi:cardiolipin synthase A/B